MVRRGLRADHGVVVVRGRDPYHPAVWGWNSARRCAGDAAIGSAFPARPRTPSASKRRWAGGGGWGDHRRSTDFSPHYPPSVIPIPHGAPWIHPPPARGPFTEHTGTGGATCARWDWAWGATPAAAGRPQRRNRPDSGRCGHRRSSTCRARSGHPQEPQGPWLCRSPDPGHFDRHRSDRRAGAPRTPACCLPVPASG